MLFKQTYGANYSPQVPGKYTSRSCYANIEVGLPDGLSLEQLNARSRHIFTIKRGIRQYLACKIQYFQELLAGVTLGQRIDKTVL